MTGHYISAPKEHPQDWELKSEQLSFMHIEGNHSRANLGGILVQTIDKYGIHAKVSVSEYLVSQIFFTHLCKDWLVYCRQCFQQFLCYQRSWQAIEG